MSTSDTSVPHFHWGMILLAGFSIIALMIAAHFIFVVAYSYLSVPGQSREFYNEFAVQTGTAFAVVLGPIISFLVGQSIAARSGSRPFLHALMAGLTYLVFNAILLLISGNGSLLGTNGFMLVQVLVLLGSVAGGLTVVSSLQTEEDVT